MPAKALETALLQYIEIRHAAWHVVATWQRLSGNIPCQRLTSSWHFSSATYVQLVVDRNDIPQSSNCRQ